MIEKKFNISLSTLVITSKDVMIKGNPIVYVSHHEDGSWEFWGKELVDESQIMLVSLEQIINRDKSILELADLPVESSAYKESSEKEWLLLPKN